MCSGSEAGSYLRLIDCVYHSTLGLRVRTKKKNSWMRNDLNEIRAHDFQSHSKVRADEAIFFFFTLVTGPRRSVSLQLSDTQSL